MDFTRLFDILPYQATKYAQEKAVSVKLKDGTWKHYSSEQLQTLIDQTSRGLLALGIEKGDKVALISTSNLPQWNILDMAIMQIGAVNIPIYPTISEADYAFIFEHAEIKCCFVNTISLYQKIERLKQNLPRLEHVYTLESLDERPFWEELLELGESVVQEKVDEIKDSIHGDEMATIIYTSGTTGTPKGVMLSHTNIISNIKSMLPIIPIEHGDRIISFLPLCHIFERTTVYLYLVVGASVYYAHSIGTIRQDFKEVKPHYFTTVPRILEKVYEQMQRKGLKLKGIRRKVFDWSLELGKQYELDVHKNASYQFKLGIARFLVFNQLIRTFGGELRGIVSGAAALQPTLARLFTAAGIPVREGYGLTETSPVLSFNRFTPGETRLGTVGIPLPGVEVKIAEDGEIIARGPNVMLGYYKRNDLTKKVIDADGWFHTGDIGEFVDRRFLKITDRKKELFKTSGGKYIAPQAIENKLKESPFIEQVMVVGSGQKFAAALIVPAFSYLRDFFKDKGEKLPSVKEMVTDKRVLQHYQQLIADYNEDLGKTETVKRFKLIATPWTLEKDELTPTLKLKRRVIKEHYKAVIEEVYNE